MTGVRSAQCQGRHVRRERVHRGDDRRSSSGVQQSPGESADVVKEPEGSGGLMRLDCADADEESEMGVNLFRRPVGNAPVVGTVFP